MTVLLELTYDIHIYLVHHYRKLEDYLKNGVECIIQNTLFSRRRGCLGRHPSSSPLEAQSWWGNHSLLGNDFFITIAAFGFGPEIFPSKEVLRKEITKRQKLIFPADSLTQNILSVDSSFVELWRVSCIMMDIFKTKALVRSWSLSILEVGFKSWSPWFFTSLQFLMGNRPPVNACVKVEWRSEDD